MRVNRLNRVLVAAAIVTAVAFVGAKVTTIAQMRQQPVSIQNNRSYNGGGDPYSYTPSSFRCSRGGSFYETNDYGVYATGKYTVLGTVLSVILDLQPLR